MEPVRKRKNAITVTEAFLLAIVTYTVLGMWREVLDAAARRVFGKNRLAAAAALTAALVLMLFVFKNVDVGRSSIYELSPDS